MSGLNHTITLSFMVVGHTKFTPDSCFGLLKQCFHRRYVQCLSHIADVKESATVNQVKFVGTKDESKKVPTYNWLTLRYSNLQRIF